MNDQPLYSKLKITGRKSLLVLQAPEECLQLFQDLPGGCVMHTTMKGGAGFEVVLLFCKNRETLARHLPAALASTAEQGITWICYPKKSSALYLDLDRNAAMQVIAALDFRPVSQVALDTDWSALRIRATANIIPKQKSNIPEIDFVNRVVRPTPDLREALNRHNVLKEFEALSFTHKKEHVEAICEAKKPETRARRILKAIEMLKERPGMMS